VISRLRAFSADPARPDIHLQWSRLAGNRVIAASRTWYRRGHQYPVHTHDYGEVFWLERGALLHRTRVGIRLLKRGDVVLMHPACAHGLEADADGDAVLINVALPWSQVPTALWGSSKAPRYLTVHAPQLAGLDDWFHTLNKAGRKKDREAFLQLVTPIIGAPESEIPAWLSTAVDQLAQAHHLVQGASALPQLCDRSREHVSRACSKHFGLSPRELVRKLRLAAMARMLREDQRAWSEIARELGIVNRRHFADTFQQRYGSKPGAWRKRMTICA